MNDNNIFAKMIGGAIVGIVLALILGLCVLAYRTTVSLFSDMGLTSGRVFGLFALGGAAGGILFMDAKEEVGE